MSLLNSIWPRGWTSLKKMLRRWNMGMLLKYQGINISGRLLKQIPSLLLSYISIKIATNFATLSTFIFPILLRNMDMWNLSKLCQLSAFRTSQMRGVLASLYIKQEKWCRIWQISTKSWKEISKILMTYWLPKA